MEGFAIHSHPFGWIACQTRTKFQSSPKVSQGGNGMQVLIASPLLALTAMGVQIIRALFGIILTL